MRTFACLLVVALLGIASSHAQSPQAPWRQDFRKVQVAEGVVAFIANDSPGGVVQGNVTLISGKRHSLVVDSGQYPALARRMVEEIRASGVPPVRYLVNTHWHGDHLLANFVFQQAYPGLTVIQHAETARMGAKSYGDWTSRKLDELKAYPAKLDKAAATGKTSKGESLTDAQRDGFRLDSVLLKQWLETSTDTRWDAPDQTITDTTTLDLGERLVTLHHFGNANTTGDIAAWDATTRTLVTGDVVVAPSPYSFGSYHSEWIDVLASMRALQPAHIVPGHGEVMQDDGYLQRLSALLAETRTQVRKAVADGKTLEQMQKEITLPAFEQQFADGDPAIVRGFREFYLAPGIPQAYKEATGAARSE